MSTTSSVLIAAILLYQFLCYLYWVLFTLISEIQSTCKFFVQCDGKATVIVATNYRSWWLQISIIYVTVLNSDFWGDRYRAMQLLPPVRAWRHQSFTLKQLAWRTIHAYGTGRNMDKNSPVAGASCRRIVEDHERFRSYDSRTITEIYDQRSEIIWS